MTRRPPRKPRSRLDPAQREHELSEAVLTLIVAVSRYGGGDTRARPTAKRLATLQQVVLLVARGVGERVRSALGAQAAAAFRKALGRRRP